MTVFSTVDNYYNYRLTSLDLSKIDKNNQMLLELRSRAVSEQNKLKNAAGKDDANESDFTNATKKSPDNSNETTSKAEFFKNQGNDEFRKKGFCKATLLYTKGINVDVKDQELKAKLYSNRATAHFNLGKKFGDLHGLSY